MLPGKKEPLAGWGNYPVADSYTIVPRNTEDCMQAIQQEKLIPRGLGRSYGDQAINDNRYVAVCTKLNYFISFDEKEGILECQSGASLEEIIGQLVAGAALPVRPSLGITRGLRCA